MTDEQMDARLRAAGEHWREQHAAPVAPAAVANALGDVVRSTNSGRAGRRHSSRRTLLAVAASVALLAGAAVGIGFAVVGNGGHGRNAVSGGGGTSALRGAWTLSTWSGEVTLSPLPEHSPPVEASLSVDAKGMLVAGDGCNTMSGHVDVQAGEFTVAEPGMSTTDMACVDQPAKVQRFTEAIHSLLSGTVQWSVTGDRLTLAKAGTTFTYARFETGGSHDPNLLPNTTWQLDTIATQGSGSDGSASSSSDYAGITIRFTTGPGFVVTYLCVTESGQAIGENGTLTLRVLDSRDAKPCASEVSDTDQQVRQRLTGPVTWSIVAGQLVIDRQGVGSLTFASVAQSTSGPAPATS